MDTIDVLIISGQGCGAAALILYLFAINITEFICRSPRYLGSVPVGPVSGHVGLTSLRFKHTPNDISWMQCASSVLILFDPADRGTFEELPDRIRLLVEARRLMPSNQQPPGLAVLAVLGPRAAAERDVSEAEGRAFARLIKARYWEVDPVTGADCSAAVATAVVEAWRPGRTHARPGWEGAMRFAGARFRVGSAVDIRAKRFLCQAVLDALGVGRDYIPRERCWDEYLEAVVRTGYLPPATKLSKLFVDYVGDGPKKARSLVRRIWNKPALNE